MVRLIEDINLYAIYASHATHAIHVDQDKHANNAAFAKLVTALHA